MLTIFWAIVVLGALIFVHEMGHFLVARWSGVRVVTFSIGFGPKLAGWRGKRRFGATDPGAEYTVSAIPLGGYVKMLGESVEDELDEEDRRYSFSHKGLWPRTAIVSAGPMFNFIFAVVALWGAFLLGMPELLPEVGAVKEDSPALAAGLQEGDRILAIDGKSIPLWTDLSETVRASEGRTLNFTVQRESDRFDLNITPEIKESKNLFGEPIQRALIGISPSGAVTTTDYGFVESFALGAQQTWAYIDLTVTSIWKLLTRVVSPDQLGGPIMIAEMAGKTAEQGATSLLQFMALVSVNLGILNLLPIPILDGGHLMFYAVEAVKGKPVGEKAYMMANRIGIALLGSLMILAFYNDLARLWPRLVAYFQ
ncbi:RIP metalloprotease RseP [Magnetofaba australis]|uniref:Zinc metalloprotease n=1 Tax=Magnetofaba australis IT-1 TaxID=1434232 RepID=A0A1Y2K6I6_9PROT|nr:RIP metalloprotease RseP [Magnetofaba australis]OSM05163.1 putative peptidase RseP [Magnetofaba australis IT-1]